jgi:hypothetical protein
MTYADVLQLAPRIVTGLNTHLAARPGEPVHIELAVLTPSQSGQAATVVLTMTGEDSRELAQERLSVSATVSEDELRLLMANCQQRLLLRLADQER